MTALAWLVLGQQAADLRLRPTPKPVVLNATEDRIEGKVRTVLGTRFEIAVAPDLAASLTAGPFTVQGRTFGHPKTRSLALTPQATLRGDPMVRPPFLLSVPLPGHPVKLGDAWTATIVGPTPMPAGVKASYRAAGTTKIAGAPCLRVGIKIDDERGGARITGGGELAVRLADGLVQSGALSILMVYHRPDPATRKMVESARLTVKAKIARA